MKAAYFGRLTDSGSMEYAASERSATIERSTTETQITCTVNLDGDGHADVKTGVGFFDHMLTLFARHSRIDLVLHASGDLHVDDHHTVEDCGIVIGDAIRQALGDKKYISRYGHAYVPMDEALARAVVDLSGRFYLSYDAIYDFAKVGDLSTSMIRHFWYSLAERAACNLHIDVLTGDDDHHRAEAIFKACARAFRMALERRPEHDPLPSTKGVL
jgi:imidazoleglycerol-phosphate dehydratase